MHSWTALSKGLCIHQVVDVKVGRNTEDNQVDVQQNHNQKDTEKNLNLTGLKKKERPFCCHIYTSVFDTPCVVGHQYHMNTTAFHAGVFATTWRPQPQPILRIRLLCCCHA